MTLFAFVGFNPERFAQLIVNVLAIGGGFFIGQILSGLAAWLLDRWLTGGRSPLGLHRTIRYVGGATLAVLVALIVFGHGEGWTLFGGGGSGAQNQAAGEQSANGTPPPVTTATPPPTSPMPETEPILAPRVVLPTQANQVQVLMLGGEDVRNQRFYLLDSETTPKTLTEVRSFLMQRKSASKSDLGLLIRFPATNILPRTHPAVVMLSQWAQDHGIAVTFPAEHP
ncbi:MAG: hypothetical protein LC104_09430 [Bacteroidales bacterium]|nr:hypothetical protein [Bacteroidales bacterium]